MHLKEGHKIAEACNEILQLVDWRICVAINDQIGLCKGRQEVKGLYAVGGDIEVGGTQVASLQKEASQCSRVKEVLV